MAASGMGMGALDFLERGLRELSEVMKMVYVLTGMLVTCVCVFAKTH